jgi:hypothetical protein
LFFYPGQRERLAKLKGQLIQYLKETGDPRFTGEKVIFDEVPYRWP